MKIRLILEKLTVDHLIHKSLVLHDPKAHCHVCVIPCQINPLSKLSRATYTYSLGLPYRLLASEFVAYSPCLISPTHATKPPIPFNFVNITFCGHKLLSSSICNFLHPPVISSLTGPSNFLSTLHKYTPSCSLTINQDSHPYTTLII